MYENQITVQVAEEESEKLYTALLQAASNVYFSISDHSKRILLI